MIRIGILLFYGRVFYPYYRAREKFMGHSFSSSLSSDSTSALKNFTSIRRQKLKSLLQENEAVIILSPPHYIKNSDQRHHFEQDSNLYYLTGFEREHSAFFISREEEKLFIEKPTEKKILWEGRMSDVDEVRAETGITSIDYIENLKSFLSQSAQQKFNYFYASQVHLPNDQLIKDWGLTVVGDYRPLIGRLRLIKDSWEQKILKQAAEISVQAHQYLRQILKGGMSEREIKRLFENKLFELGATEVAYESIIAAGSNATHLHYHDYSGSLAPQDLLLVDAAGKIGRYVSDITRTFFVGTATDEQLMIYNMVEKAKKAGLKEAKPGSHLGLIHETCKSVLKEELLRAKIISTEEEVTTLFPHKTSHWIGIDVHDDCPRDNQGQPILLEPGMYFSVEPGIYFGKWMDQKYKKFHGIGIRLEDDIMVTVDGHENYTENA